MERVPENALGGVGRHGLFQGGTADGERLEGLMRYHVLFVLRLAIGEVQIAGLVPEPNEAWRKPVPRKRMRPRTCLLQLYQWSLGVDLVVAPRKSPWDGPCRRMVGRWDAALDGDRPSGGRRADRPDWETVQENNRAFTTRQFTTRQ